MPKQTYENVRMEVGAHQIEFLWETCLAQLQNYFFYCIYLPIVDNVDNDNKLPLFPQFK